MKLYSLIIVIPVPAVIIRILDNRDVMTIGQRAIMIDDAYKVILSGYVKALQELIVLNVV